MMSKTGPTWAIAAAGFAATSLAAAPAGWNGTYAYDFEGGRTAGGTGIVVNYRIRIAPGICRIKADGFQTDTDIVCKAVPRNGRIDIEFATFGDGRLVNQYNVAEYRAGERLLSFGHNARGILVTGWGALSPFDKDKRPLGRFFKRVR